MNPKLNDTTPRAVKPQIYSWPPELELTHQTTSTQDIECNNVMVTHFFVNTVPFTSLSRTEFLPHTPGTPKRKKPSFGHLYRLLPAPLTNSVLSRQARVPSKAGPDSCPGLRVPGTLQKSLPGAAVPSPPQTPSTGLLTLNPLSRPRARWTPHLLPRHTRNRVPAPAQGRAQAQAGPTSPPRSPHRPGRPETSARALASPRDLTPEPAPLARARQYSPSYCRSTRTSRKGNTDPSRLVTEPGATMSEGGAGEKQGCRTHQPPLALKMQLRPHAVRSLSGLSSSSWHPGEESSGRRGLEDATP